MADDADDEEEEGGGGKKKIIMIVGGLVVAGAVYNFVLKSPPPDEDAMPEEMAAEIEPIEGEIVQMEEMILNIDGESATGFLRIGLAVVLEEGILAADFEAELPIAKDVAVHYLSSLSGDQLRSTDGRDAAKEELSLLIREAYGDEKVIRVLFTSLVMQ